MPKNKQPLVERSYKADPLTLYKAFFSQTKFLNFDSPS